MMTGMIACLSGSYLVTLSVSSHALSSNFACSLANAMMGKDVHTALSLTQSVTQSRSTLTGYSRDLSPLLLLSGIEPNPGPMSAEEVEAKLQELRRNIKDDMKTDILDCMNAQMSSITSQLTELVGSVRKIGDDVIALRLKVAEQDKEISVIKEKYEEAKDRLVETERQLEIMEQHSRRNNLLIHGIAEDERESTQVCERKTIDAINEVIPQLLDGGSLARVHRVGRKIAGKDRPVLLQVLQSSDKSAILNEKEEYRRKNIGVSCDLTRQQREMMTQARQEGKIGYFRGGQFYTKPMQRVTTGGRGPSSTDNTSNTSSIDGHNDQGVRRSSRQQGRRR